MNPWRLFPLALAVVLLGGHALFSHIAHQSTDPDPCVQAVPCELQVNYVIDGDTLKLTTGERLRFDRLDAPELDEPDGPETRRCVEEIINSASGEVTVELVGRERYGRLLGRVISPHLGRCF